MLRAVFVDVLTDASTDGADTTYRVDTDSEGAYTVEVDGAFLFSETLSDDAFPRGKDWLMLGPTGPRRLRMAVEHLCQHRGGVCKTLSRS